MKSEINPQITLFQGLLACVALIACCAWSTTSLAEEAPDPAGGNPAVMPQPAAAPLVPRTELTPPAQAPAPPHMPPRPMGPGSMANLPPSLPMLQKIKPGLDGLGPIEINRKERSIAFPAMINMKKGLLEYLLVRTGGKTHESLFRTQVEPVQLQLAMLLLGAEGTDRPLARQGDPGAPKGSPVAVNASYLKDGRMEQISPEIWITRKSDAGMTESETLKWMFTGSKISNGRFMAQLEGSIIAIYHDPVALFDNASPGGENNRVWFVNEATVPPVGTPVTLTITLKN